MSKWGLDALMAKLSSTISEDDDDVGAVDDNDDDGNFDDKVCIVIRITLIVIFLINTLLTKDPLMVSWWRSLTTYHIDDRGACWHCFWFEFDKTE